MIIVDRDYLESIRQMISSAKKLLAEAGYPEGKGLPEITYETTATTISRQMSEYFRAGGRVLNAPRNRSRTMGCCPTFKPSTGAW